MSPEMKGNLLMFGGMLAHDFLNNNVDWYHDFHDTMCDWKDEFIERPMNTYVVRPLAEFMDDRVTRGSTAPQPAAGGVGQKPPILPAAPTSQPMDPHDIGKIGEDVLKKLGGESQRSFPTSMGDRVADQLVDGIAHESKVGYQSLTGDIRLQIAKDKELLRSKDVDGVVWHFFTSPFTGKRGPSAELLKALQDAGFGVEIH